MQRFDLDEAIKILGLEIRAEMAHEGRSFDVACRTVLRAVRKAEKLNELEGFYYIQNGKVHPCIHSEDADYDESIDMVN